MKQKYIKELKRLAGKEGALRPSEVWEAARSPKSPLHDYYNWDVEAAAKAHWLSETRELIRSYKVVIQYQETTRRISTKAYVRDPDVPDDAEGYVATEVVKDDPARARRVLHAGLKGNITALENLRDSAEVWNLGAEAGLLTAALEHLDKLARFLEMGSKAARHAA